MLPQVVTMVTSHDISEFKNVFIQDNLDFEMPIMTHPEYYIGMFCSVCYFTPP